MANCGCNITTRLLSPGVFNLKQFLNSTETMQWTVSSRYCGVHDLGDYDAFLVLQKSTGEIDEVALTKVLNNADENGNQTITLTWNVGTYATWLTGYVKYQIVFRGDYLSGLGVIGCATTAANGSYSVDNELASGNARSWTNTAESAYKINYDTTNSRWQLINGGTVVDYQTFPDSEPCRGTWNNIGVANNTACTWESLEALMFISDSIAADEHVSAKCPTILHQMWNMLRRSQAASIASVTFAGDVTAANWTGSSAPYTLNVATLLDLPNDALVAGIKLYQTRNNNKKEIANIEVNIATGSTIGATIRCAEKIAGVIYVFSYGYTNANITYLEESTGIQGSLSFSEVGSETSDSGITYVTI